MLPFDHPFFRDLRAPLHISHRGGALLYPENTLLAFRESVGRWKTDVIELDVHVTRDGEVVVHHDDTLERCTDLEGPVASFRYAELERADAGYRFSPDEGVSFPFRGKGIRIPRLAEVLSAFRGLRWNIELKQTSPGPEKVVAQVLRSSGQLDRMCIGSEHDEVAARLLGELPDACFFYPRLALAEFVLGVREGQVPNSDVPWRVLDMPLFFGSARIAEPGLFSAARSLGRWVNVWTIDDESEMRRLCVDGVGGIMTDRPDLLREVLDGDRLRS